MAIRIGFLIFSIYCLLTFSNLYPQSPISLNGYYKNYSAAIDIPDFRNFQSMQSNLLGWVNNRIRIRANIRLSSSISYIIAYDFSPRIQDRSFFEDQAFLFEIDPFSYRLIDFNQLLYPDENEVKSFGIFHNLDRTYFTIKIPQADFIIGRQAIAWGSARMVNPSDVIAPFAFYQLDTEDRLGVDAARIRIPIGFMHEIDVGYIFGEDFHFKNSAFFGRTKLYTFQSDLSFLILGFRENMLLGVDAARAIGGAGFWFESAYVFVNALSKNNNNIYEDYLRISTGLDYSFGEKSYGYVELHYNGIGVTDPSDYLSIISHPAYSEGAVYLLGKYYLAPGINYQLTPLTILNCVAFVNLTDPSIYIAPTIEYNISQNIYISGGLYLGAGQEAVISLRNGLPLLAFNSEFGNYPNLYYTSFRIYF